MSNLIQARLISLNFRVTSKKWGVFKQNNTDVIPSDEKFNVCCVLAYITTCWALYCGSNKKCTGTWVITLQFTWVWVTHKSECLTRDYRCTFEAIFNKDTFEWHVRLTRIGGASGWNAASGGRRQTDLVSLYCSEQWEWAVLCWSQSQLLITDKLILIWLPKGMVG
jgi:hypothetical protein